MQRPSLILAAVLCALPLVFAGCSSLLLAAKLSPPGPRAFDFVTDTLANPAPEPPTLGNREPLANPAVRGWADAQVARQFFLHARFEPAATPPTSERRIALVREVLGRNSAEMSAETQRVLIPGYANLREFSRLQGHLLRAESWLTCGCEHRAPLVKKAFGGSDGGRVAARLTATVAAHRPALVRLYRQRQLRYDRALLVYGAREDGGGTRFIAYDPATPRQPVELAFDRARRAFTLADESEAAGSALGLALE